jgi:hypothetical protein
MPDLMPISGVTGWQRTAAIAAVAGILISTHLNPEVAAHVMRVTETARWLEWEGWHSLSAERPVSDWLDRMWWARFVRTGLAPRSLRLSNPRKTAFVGWILFRCGINFEALSSAA